MKINLDLSPTDGLTNDRFHFETLKAASGGADLTFEVRNNDGTFVGSMTVFAPNGNDGVDGLMARGYGELIDILRQGIHELDKVRSIHLRNAAKIMG